MKKIFILFIMNLALAGVTAAANTLQTPEELMRELHITGAKTANNPTATAVQAGKNQVPQGSQAQPAAAGLTSTALTGVIAGVTGTAAARAPAGTTISAADVDEGQAAYDSLTITPDFNYRPAFVESKYEKNKLLSDIEVSAVEAVPFGFLLTSMGIFGIEALGQHTLQPKLKTLQEYTPVYAISIGALAALNVVVNTLFFYDYPKEDSNVKKTEEK
jgi:hypothetical protein